MLGHPAEENEKMLRTVGSFKTDETGHPVSLPDLEPNSTFVVCHDEEVPAAQPMESRQEIIKWIDDCILGDLRTLRLGIDRFHEKPVTPRPLGGCNFLLAAGCCMALEYFGQVYGQGSNATEGGMSWTFYGQLTLGIARYMGCYGPPSGTESSIAPGRKPSASEATTPIVLQWVQTLGWTVNTWNPQPTARATA